MYIVKVCMAFYAFKQPPKVILLGIRFYNIRGSDTQIWAANQAKYRVDLSEFSGGLNMLENIHARTP